MKRSLIVLLSLFFVITAGCPQREAQSEKITIVVSIVPLAEFVEKIGGDNVVVSVMVPPGASPHAYEPTPGQLTEVSKAQMYVKVGSPIEFELVWLNKILSTNKDIFVCDASSEVELVKMHQYHTHEERKRQSDKGLDPHIWLSPKNAKIMVKNICSSFISIDSVNEKCYTANKEKYLKKLDSLDRYIEKILKEKTNRKFMVYHPSWAYFARDYNLEQISVEAEGKEPTAKGIQHLIEQARKYNIKVIFASPQFNTESAEVVAREIQGRVALINPLAKNYITNMKKVAQTLSEAME